MVRSVLRRYFFQYDRATRLFQVNEHLHTGLDSEIYVGERKADSKKVAIKMSAKSQVREAQRHLALLDDDDPLGVPAIFSYENCKESGKTYLVTECLGLSLYDILRRLEKRRMRLKDVCMISLRVIACLKYFHDKGFVHGDVNPKTILTGLQDKRSEMFLVDYKSLRPWDHKETRIPCEDERVTRRNSNYRSPRSCISPVLAPRDDMISLSYTIIELLNGELPCEKNNEMNCSHKLNKIKEQVGKGLSVCGDLPNEIADFVKAVHSLSSAERPDYIALSELFVACLDRIIEADDNDYEWFDNPGISA